MLKKGLLASIFVLPALAISPILSNIEKPLTDSKTVIFSPKNNKIEDPILLKIGNLTVNSNEFLQLYKKNQIAGDTVNTERSIKDYANLFVNFKLKVLAAQQQGLDTTQAFREELQTYRKQLSQSYLTEKNVSEVLVKEVYERMKEELSVAHILLNCSPDASPQDSMRVYLELLKIRERAVSGEDFNKLAKMFSNDPSVTGNDGNLDYITAMSTVYPFENMAYQTSKGKISMPFRSKFGFHILKVNDRRESLGKVRVAHIMVKIEANASEKDKNDAKLKIDEIFKKLQSGDKFENVCKKLSEDETTRNSNGILEMFGAGQMVKEFEQAAFSLKQIGEISLPIRTKFGWHIIKLIEKKSLEPFTEIQSYLKQKIQADPRSNLGRTALVRRLRKDNKVVENEEILRQVIAGVDTRLLKNTWDFDEKSPLANKILFTQGEEKREYSVLKFWNYLKTKQKGLENGTVNMAVAKIYNDFTENEIIKFEDELLENKYIDFKLLMQEYHDGILSYEMMNQNVWQKALMDTMGLKSFFLTNKGKYVMPERMNGQLIMAESQVKLEEVQKALAQNPYQMGRRINDFLYDKNQSGITEELKEKLFDALVVLKKNPDYQIEVIGNIDPTEADSISGLRVKNVVRYLQDNGIKLSRINEKDNSKFEPISRTDRKLNQRLAFNFVSNSLKDLQKKFNAEKPESVSITEGFFRKGDNKIVDGVKWEIGQSKFDKSGKYYNLKINRVEAKRPKTFMESRGAVINDYQNFLETRWLNQLKTAYPVEINQEELNKLSK